MPAKPIAIVPLTVPLANITSGNQRTEAPASHLAIHRSPGLVWRSDGISDVWIRGFLPSAEAIDFVALLAANAQPGTTIRVRLGANQAQVDGTAPYDSGVQPFISPAVTTDNGLYNSHLEIPAVQNATWFRIDIGGHTGDFSAAHLVLGKAIRPARYYDRGFERGFEDLGDHELSRWGVASQSGGYMLRTLNFRLGWVDREEHRTLFEPMFRRIGKRNPVLWCFDPEASIYRQSHTYFGWMKQNPVAVQGQKPNTYGIEFTIVSQI